MIADKLKETRSREESPRSGVSSSAPRLDLWEQSLPWARQSMSDLLVQFKVPEAAGFAVAS